MKAITCPDCGRPYVSRGTWVIRCARCAHARLLAYYRRRNAIHPRPRERKPRTPEQEQRRRDKRRAARLLPNITAAMAKVNKALDRMEAELAMDYRNAMHKAWRRENEKAILQDRWRRAQRKRRRVVARNERTPEAIAGLWLSVCRAFGFRCAYCGMTSHNARAEGFDLQIDHIVPVTDPCCIHGADNAAPACIHCNASKGNRDLLEWAAIKGAQLSPIVVAKYHRMRGIYAA